MILKHIIGVVLVIFSSQLNAQDLLQPHFEGDLQISATEGHYKLTWTFPRSETKYDYGTVSFQLEEALNPEFREARKIYEGPDLAKFISGQPNGHYYYRIRLYDPQKGESGPWSETLTAVVDHHSLALAFSLFGLGALVFILTVGVVVTGVRRVKNQEA